MGPFKCVECGVWWAGMEHRCKPLQPATGTGVTVTMPAGHCHGCMTAICHAADHIPCLVHRSGWSIT